MMIGRRKRALTLVRPLALGTALLASSLAAKCIYAQQRTDAPAGSVPPTSLVAPATPASVDLNDTGAVAAFVDGVMRAHMERLKIPGAVVSIVKDGKVLYAGGYGRANFETDQSVDPRTSLFRIASVTKLFTWTAVMQLVEQGKLDLDADVNSYLRSVKIPATYPQPITLRHLMTHTAGFEDGGVGYGISIDPEHLLPISEALARHMPARVRPSGVMSAYSNYGAALAGLIVQEVSGMSYQDYIQQNLFDPLGMKFATVREPLPAALTPYRVLGYARENGGFVAGRATFEGGFAPAGSGSVAALDMAHFMIAQLQEGRYGERQILRAETMKLMHAVAFQLDPRLPGMCLGIYQLRMNGLQVLAHGGADPLFRTELYLVPDKQLGIFASYSGGPGDEAARGLAQVFLDRYFPAPALQLPPVPADFSRTAQKYAGSYQFTRRSHTKIERLDGLLSQRHVSVSGNRLVLGQGEDQAEFAPIGPDLFQEVGGPRQIAFRTNAQGEVTHMFFDAAAYLPLERTPLSDNSSLWYRLLGVSLLILVSIVVAFAGRWRRINALPKPQRRVVWLLGVTALWALGTCCVGVAALVTSDLLTLLSSIPGSLNLFLAMIVILTGLAALLLMAAIRVWKHGFWRLRARLGYTVATMAVVALCWFFQHWNLLGWKFG